MLLVSGYSGIGKSSLINEIHKPVLQQRGFFIAGKFDQFQRDVPYASLIQAFQELIRQLLTESAESLENWKSKLLANIGNNGQVIIDVIPEIELVIGNQPEVPKLAASEAQNRFNRVFQEFIGVFAQKEHPLVLFLDDLQWADSPSLKLIQTLIGDSNSQYLLLLGAYRDNEVSLTHPLTIEAEYLNTNYQQSKQLIDIALQKANTLLDKIRIYKRQIQFYIAQGDLPASIDTALASAAMLGVAIPTDTEAISRYCEQIRQSLSLEISQIRDLANLPVMGDRNIQAATEILNTLTGPVYIVRPQLVLPIQLTIVSLSVQYGNCAASSLAYCMYGFLLCTVFGNYIDAGYEYGQLSLQIVDKLNAKALKCQVLKVYSTHIQPRKQPLRAACETLLLSMQSSLETGNPEFLGYGSGEYCMYLFFSGENLETVEQKVVPYVSLVESFKQDLGIYYIRITRQIVLNLIGQTSNPLILTGSSFNEVTMLPVVVAADWQMLLCCFYLLKLILAYLFKDFTAALEYAQLSATNLSGVLGMIMAYEFHFYYSLVLLAQYPQLDADAQQKALNQVIINQDVLLVQAASAPMNYQHKYDLVAAEIARIQGQELAAMAGYDAAIQGAKNHNFIQEEALANELAAEFYLSLGREKIAKTYMDDAYSGYISWGANAKVKDLEMRYPQLIVKSRRTIGSTDKNSITTTSSSTGDLLDLRTVIKASQAITSEIVIDKLLDKLILIVLQNAGAQRGLLLSEQAGNWVVTAANPKDFNQFPISVINYVQRTLTNVVISDGTTAEVYQNDPYIIAYQPKSILCTPILYQGKLRNILYLENNLTADAFTPDRIEILKILSTQAAISLENAELYRDLSTANAQLEDYSRTLEVKVAERTEQLAMANQDLSDFAHVVSHDLKAPLRSIGMLAQWIAADYAERLDEEGKEQLELMVEQVRRSQVLIDGILHYSRIGRTPESQQPVNLTELVTEVIEILSPPTHIHISIDTQLPTLIGDATRLRQVWQNLLSNAIKYLDKPAGSITISCTSVPNYWQFSVSDNGQGIAEKYFDHIFQLFQTIQPNHPGDSTGVGLTVVKKIVELYGGKVWVQSQVGTGSTFFFTLPQSGGRVINGIQN